MILYPAIDLLEGKCVRLKKGDFSTSKTYYEYPLEAAKYWESKGSKHLHIVDLNGSKSGSFYHYQDLKRICQETDLKIQFGGGIRSFDQVKDLIDLGVDKVVVGSLAIKNPPLFKSLLEAFGQQIVCAIDAKDGFIATEGWTKSSEMDYLTFAQEIEAMGCKEVLYTDISRDGMLTGPDLEGYARLKAATNLKVIASGGVSSLEDINQLIEAQLEALIVGKAFYEKRFTFEEALGLINNRRTND